MNMNKRKWQIRAARRLLSEPRLIAFLRKVYQQQEDEVLAVELINNELDTEKNLDDILYSRDDYGYLLSVKQISESEFQITFGCQPGRDVGDCGEWVVSFDGNTVDALSGGLKWIV